MTVHCPRNVPFPICPVPHLVNIPFPIYPDSYLINILFNICFVSYLVNKLFNICSVSYLVNTLFPICPVSYLINIPFAICSHSYLVIVLLFTFSSWKSAHQCPCSTNQQQHSRSSVGGASHTKRRSQSEEVFLQTFEVFLQTSNFANWWPLGQDLYKVSGFSSSVSFINLM